ncbi:alpha-galactosidase [Alicyclobacillus curvatus]|nr:alpha-galactosidase [Alicyclobacillus curvatus]
MSEPKQILIEENGLNLVFEITDELDVRLLHLSAVPFQKETIVKEHLKQKFRMVEVHASGEDQADHHGQKHTGTNPGLRLRYLRHVDMVTQHGRKFELTMMDPLMNLFVTSHFQFYEGISVVRCWTAVRNDGKDSVGLEYVTSFALTGLGKEGLLPWESKMRLMIPHNAWFGEAQWTSHLLPELGLQRVGSFSTNRIAVNSTGSWSTSQFVPSAVLVNEETETSLFWQIEHNGSWHFEIGDQFRHLYLHLSGPTYQEHQWWKELKPGATFTTVPVAVGAVNGTWDRALQELTQYRRAMRQKHSDYERLPVIFNTFMNSLGGDVTAENVRPLIGTASKVGCEVFCIDCGWYADGDWWGTVGTWQPSARRFPDGMETTFAEIRANGMIPGLWLEPEVLGLESGKLVPKEWLFERYGKPVIDHGRYQLDYRNPEVRAYMDTVVDDLIRNFGLGYLKFDYNINAGVGTALFSDSVGDGLLEHNRGYLVWLERLMARHPDLIIENCGSGGMRMDYAMLERHTVQSVTDQDDYLRNAVIAAACASVVTPEQAAVWAYPLPTGNFVRDGVVDEAASTDATVLNMVNALLLRVHLSGPLCALDEKRLSQVEQAITTYKSLRKDILDARPVWPIGLPSFRSKWLSFGLLVSGNRACYIAVWRLDAESERCSIPLTKLTPVDWQPVGLTMLEDEPSGTLLGAYRCVSVKVVYPQDFLCSCSFNAELSSVEVHLPHQNSACLLKIDIT